MSASSSSLKHRRGYMAALVVGTALSTFGSAAAQAPESRAVAGITRYCNACWRNARVQPDSWPDCTQEVFRRLLERVDTDRWQNILAQETDERREFLRAIDTVKKRAQRAHRHAPLTTEIKDANQTCRRDIEERRHNVLQTARERLSSRQADIVAMTLDGWSVAEIADELQITPMRVSDEKYKAIRRLRENLA